MFYEEKLYQLRKAWYPALMLEDIPRRDAEVECSTAWELVRTAKARAAPLDLRIVLPIRASRMLPR